MELIRHLFMRVTDTNSVSETSTVDPRDQQKIIARADGLFNATTSESRVPPGTPMATFEMLSQLQQQHVVIETIHAFIQEERRRNYHFLGNHSHRYMNQEDLLNVSAEGGQYTFTECCRHSYERTVSLEVASSPSSVPTTDNLIITEARRNSTSTPVTATEWLRSTYFWDNTWELRVPEEQYNEQRTWWENNAKVFPLLSLPPELRDAIYLQTVGPVVLPEYHDQITLGVGLTHRNPRQGTHRDPDVHEPDLTILKVSRQVRSEAMRVANRDATKRFRVIQSPVPVVSNFMKYLNVSARSGFLRVIQLEMTAKRYFEFIGISPTRETPLQSISGARGVDILRTFRTLQELDFRFIGPKHKFAICPWGIGSPNIIHSCQKVWIHWFFILTWDTLHELLVKKKVRISVSGCIKTSTRKYWQNIFKNSNCTNYMPMIKALEQQIRLEKKEYEPVACRCSALCGKDPGIRDIQWNAHEVRNIEGLKEHAERCYWDFGD